MTTGTVAPFTGAWIEIEVVDALSVLPDVAPFAGAWIEIWCRVLVLLRWKRRSLHGSVD